MTWALPDAPNLPHPRSDQTNRPSAELGIDLTGGELIGGDPYPAFAWMREHAPVFHDEGNGLWTLAAYHDVKTASTDTVTYSNAGWIRPKFPPLPYALLQDPEQLELLLSEPALLPAAIEELLRWLTPIKNMARVVTRDIELGGRTPNEGDEVLLLYPSANRDDAVFSDPGRFDVTRSSNPHLAFGSGAHFRLGNQLARVELGVMFEQLLARLPDLALSGSGPLPRRPANFITEIEPMPVTFTPSPRSVPPRPDRRPSPSAAWQQNRRESIHRDR